ncbi:MAG: shikimate dehydrogenase [Solirubrobacteraceae bacterium]
MREELTERRRFVAGLIGGGIATSFTPALHEREADALGLSYSYQLIDIDVLGLGAADAGRLLGEAQRMGFSGVNVTHPCKQVVIPYLDELAPAAAALGAVNTVVFADGRSVGYNTDQPAFKESLVVGLPGEDRYDVVVLGAGGAGAAVANAALELGSAQLSIVDIERGRALRLAESLSARFPQAIVRGLGPAGLADALDGADGLIHATPTGMANHPGIPLDPETLQERTWVADIVYRPLNTELLRVARQRGCKTVDGSGMAVIQAALSFALFTGIAPDRERMFGEFATLALAEVEAEAGIDGKSPTGRAL